MDCTQLVQSFYMKTYSNADNILTSDKFTIYHHHVIESLLLILNVFIYTFWFEDSFDSSDNYVVYDWWTEAVFGANFNLNICICEFLLCLL